MGNGFSITSQVGCFIDGETIDRVVAVVYAKVLSIYQQKKRSSDVCRFNPFYVLDLVKYYC